VTALQLDKQVELAGRSLNVGRPAGYNPSPAMPQPAPLALPPGFAAPAPAPPAMVPGLGITGAEAGAAAAAAAVGGGNLGGLQALLRAQAAPPTGRKQKELYVGNLPVGLVTAQTLRDLFTAPLRTMPGFDESLGPPVANCDLNPDGKFAFVEFRDEAICSLALTLFDKTELCGRTLNVGRPRGYVDPGAVATAPIIPGLAAFAAQPAAPPAQPASTTCLRLNGLITPDILDDDAEYADVLDDIRQECERSGPVAEMKIPRVGDTRGSCFVRFVDTVGSGKARESLHQRQFDGNTVTAVFIPESDMPQ